MNRRNLQKKLNKMEARKLPNMVFKRMIIRKLKNQLEIKTIWSCFLIHSATLCLLIGVFIAFIFKVIINSYIPISLLLYIYYGAKIGLQLSGK